MNSTNSQIVKVILNNLLTPIIYMFSDERETDFICFCDRNVLMKDLRDLEVKLEHILEKKVAIVDIREIPETERIDIINNGELIYYEDELIKKLFETSMVEDLRQAVNRKAAILERRKVCGTVHLS